MEFVGPALCSEMVASGLRNKLTRSRGAEPDW